MPIDPGTAHALEIAFAAIPGVVGAVVLEDPNEPEAIEVQAFVPEGADVAAVRATVQEVAATLTHRRVDVVALELADADAAGGPASSGPGGTAPSRARGRPRLVSVVIDSSVTTARHEAHVTLEDVEVAAGRAVVGRDPAIAVVAAACDALAGGTPDRPEPRAVERIEIAGFEVVIVVVSIRGRPLVGSAILDDEPEPAAVVRATLDAVNRWYGRG